MKMFTFKRGGAHPPERKSLSEHKPLADIPIPDIVQINLNQHLGKPAKPVVKMRDEVTVGQRIGEADGMFSAHIHSSVSGKIKKIQKMMTAVGTVSDTVIIEVDSEKTRTDYEKYQTHNGLNVNETAPDVLREKIKEAGVVGKGGATFSTFVKLSPPPDKTIDTIFINGAECEPYLTADHQLMMEKTEEILDGIIIINRILDVYNTYIGIEDNKPDAIARFQEVIAKGNYRGIQVAPLKTKYPQGGEKQLIEAITRRQVPSGKLPFDVGALVQNVGTAYAVYEAVYYDKPLIERIATVSGFVKNPGNYRIKIGMTFDHILQSGAGGVCDADHVSEILNGGPMMGKAVRSTGVTATKGTSGILVLSDTDFKFEDEGPCIRCARCVSVCPMGLMPTTLAINAQHNRPEELGNVMDCMECGTCSYICPTNRQLVHWIRIGKTVFRNADRSAK